MEPVLLGTAAALLLAPQLVSVQSQQAQAGRPVAQTCMNDLQAFSKQQTYNQRRQEIGQFRQKQSGGKSG